MYTIHIYIYIYVHTINTCILYIHAYTTYMHVIYTCVSVHRHAQFGQFRQHFAVQRTYNLKSVNLHVLYTYVFKKNSRTHCIYAYVCTHVGMLYMSTCAKRDAFNVQIHVRIVYMHMYALTLACSTYRSVQTEMR